MRANGVRSLDVSCWLCHHWAILSAERWPDSTPVPAFGPRMVCSRCGIIGADTRPHWTEQPPRETLTGAQHSTSMITPASAHVLTTYSKFGFWLSGRYGEDLRPLPLGDRRRGWRDCSGGATERSATHDDTTTGKTGFSAGPLRPRFDAAEQRNPLLGSLPDSRQIDVKNRAMINSG
jgi:hypothetical protein